MNPVNVTLSIQSIEQSISLNVGTTNHDVSIGFKEQIISGGGLPWFPGPYEVTPTPSGFALETRNKSMHEDLEIEPIPYSEVSNPSGGKTVNIAFVL